MTDRELMQQALEALVAAYQGKDKAGQVTEAITAIREALAEQPAQQQEPVEIDVGQLEYKGNSVGYIYQKMQAYRLGIDNAWSALRAKDIHPDGKTSLADMIAKHTISPASKPWVGLTQQDIDIAFDDTQEGGGFNEFARALEAKLREKNAPQQSKEDA